MKRACFFLFIVCVLLCCSFTSCSSTKTELKTEYVALTTDISEIVAPVIAKRPDNSVLNINTSNILTLLDVTQNSVQYQKAWEMWENYAEMLEGVLLQISDVLEKRSV